MTNKIIYFMIEDKEIRAIAIDENGMNIPIELPKQKIEDALRAVIEGTHPSVLHEQHIKRGVLPRNFVCPIGAPETSALLEPGSK
jgi:hypothetical protein